MRRWPWWTTSGDSPWWLRASLRQVWRVIVFVVGGTIVLIGLVLVVAPGPAFIVLPLGLAILAVEFAWARRLLERVRAGFETARGRYRRPGSSKRSE